MIKFDRWAPVRNGNAYCAPACGYGCTYAAFELATREAEELAARMGPSWETQVWENGGWNYAVKKGIARITPNTRGAKRRDEWVVIDYTSWLNPDGMQFIFRAATPEDALGMSLQNARTFETRLHDALNEIGEE